MKRKGKKLTEIIHSENRQHSPEVEQLIQGKLPFVTRHGITCIIIILFVVCAAILLTEGAFQQLIKQMIDYTIEHIKSKI